MNKRFSFKAKIYLSSTMRALTLFMLIVNAVALPVPSVQAQSGQIELFASGLSFPFGLVFDDAGNLYVANEDNGGDSISKILPNGTVTTFTTGLTGASGLAFNSLGTLYTSDDTNRVFIVNSSGIQTILIDETAGLENPNALAFDSTNNLYIASAGGFISKYSSSLGLSLSFATGFYTPQSVVVDEVNGGLITSDFTGQIYQIDLSTGNSTVYVDTLRPSSQGGLILDADGNLFYSAYEHDEVLRIDAVTKEVTICLSGISQPRGLAFDSAGWLYVTSYDTGEVYRAQGCQPVIPARIGLVTDEGGVDDQSFNMMAYQGLQQAETDLGITGTLYESASSDDYVPLLQQCADDGNDLCFAVGFLMDEAVDTAANANPDTSFAILDFPKDSGSSNLRGIQFNIQEAGYLVGTLAGKMTRSNMIGTVAGMEILPVIGFVEGYRNGAQCANPDVNVLINYTGTFIDPGLGAIEAQEMMNHGADVIFGVGAMTGNGAILYSAQNGGWSIGVDIDQYLTVFGDGTVPGSDKMLTSAMKNLDVAVRGTIQDYINGTFSAGTVTYHLADGGVGLAPYHETDSSIPQATKDYVNGVKADIINGTRDVDGTCRDEPPYNPSFSVRLNENQVHGYEWLLGSDVTLFIDGNTIETKTVTQADWDPDQTFVWFDLRESSWTLQVGQFIELTDGTITKSHTVTSLVVDGVDADADKVFGTAVPDSQIDVGHIYCDETGCVGFRREIANQDGEWLADFSVAGDDDDEKDIVDIIQGTGSEARQCDNDGDCTQYGWQVAWPPGFGVQLDETNPSIHAGGFLSNASLSVTIDDPDTLDDPDYESTEILDSDGGLIFKIGYIVQPDDIVTLSDGVTTVSQRVKYLVINTVDAEADVISGTTEPSIAVTVWSPNNYNMPAIDLIADENGDWTANYSGKYDLTPGMDGFVEVRGETGGGTMRRWRVPNPRMTVFPEREAVDVWDWPDGAMVTATVDGKSECTAQGLSEYPWDPWTTYVGMNFPKGCDVMVGDVVTVTDGETTRTHVVQNLTVIEANAEADTVTGTANTGEVVYVWPHEYGEYEVQPTAVGGNWTADFAAEFDLQPGMDGRAEVRDEDGNSTAVDWHAPNPRMTVFPEWEAVEVWDWPDGVTVYASVIHKPICTAQGLSEYPEWDPWTTNVWMNFPEGCTVTVGDIVTVTDNETPRTHVVQNITITEANAEADTVTGTANTGEVVYVWPHQYGEYEVQPTVVGGNWTADFTTVGFDLQPGMDGRAEVRDENGNSTAVDWHAPNPRMTVFPEWESVEVWDWPDGATVYASVAGKPACIAQGLSEYPEWDPWATNVWMNFPEGCNVTVGNIVTVTDNETPRTHIVQNITITEANAEADTVTGTADTSEVVYVWPHQYGEYEVQPTADGGTWTADFAVFGDVLQPGMDGRAEVRDEAGNSTAVDWNVPNPRIRALPAVNEVHGYDWQMGASVQLTIDDDTDPNNGFLYEDTKTVERMNWDWNHTEILFYLWEDDFTLQPGQYITMTDGNTIKTHWVTSLSVTMIDPVADTVSGKATPGSKVNVGGACDENGCANRSVIADENDDWIADFAHVGENYNEQDLLDIRAGVGGDVDQFDDDGDYTEVQWRVPNPIIEIRANFDHIDGYEWPAGATITIEINDPGTTEPEPDYSAQVTVGTAPWDPNQTYFELNLWDVFDIQPNFVVTATNDVTTRQLTVTNLGFTDIDVDANTVTGKAAPEGQIDIWACEFNNCFNIDGVPVDEFGDWTADFQGVYDIQPGTWVDSSQRDEQGNSTMFGIQIPGAEIAGTIYAVENELVIEAGGVMVEVCNTDQSVCRNALTDENGNYTIAYLPKGEFNLKAYPAGDGLPGYSFAPVTITDYITYYADDIVLPGPPTPPPSGAVQPSHEGGGTIVVYIGDPLTLITHGDPGGTATFEITVYEDGYTDNGQMVETPASSGTYIATIPPLVSHHGVAEIVYTISYPDKDPKVTSFFIYIDPSGVVQTTEGVPLQGATVTLLRSDNPDGPFDVVPDGNVLMSPSNRTNPDTTDEYGKYGWDVLAGFYIVRAEYPGCYSPDDPLQPFVESEVLTIPPPVTDLVLVLDCPNLPPRADAGVDKVVDEGTEITLDASASYDPEGGALSYAWDLDNDGDYDDASGVTTEVSFPDNGVFIIGLQVTDDGGLTASDTQVITVHNVSPVIDSLTAPEGPVQLGTTVYLTAMFSDSGTGDTFTATWNWEDGSTTEGVVTDRTVTGSHLYMNPGVYTVRLRVADDDGGVATYVHQYIVIYDPDGGFVTGGGWFIDPATGSKAHFGFNPKYHKDGLLKGEAEFRLNGMNFRSTSLDWMVIKGGEASFMGMGTINGSGEYAILISVIDGNIAGGADRIHVIIWDANTGDVIYDNEPGVPEFADPTMPIGGGSIVIHEAK